MLLLEDFLRGPSATDSFKGGHRPGREFAAPTEFGKQIRMLLEEAVEDFLQNLRVVVVDKIMAVWGQNGRSLGLGKQVRPCQHGAWLEVTPVPVAPAIFAVQPQDLLAAFPQLRNSSLVRSAHQALVDGSAQGRQRDFPPDLARFDVNGE